MTLCQQLQHTHTLPEFILVCILAPGGGLGHGTNRQGRHRTTGALWRCGWYLAVPLPLWYLIRLFCIELIALLLSQHLLCELRGDDTKASESHAGTMYSAHHQKPLTTGIQVQQ